MPEPIEEALQNVRGGHLVDDFRTPRPAGIGFQQGAGHGGGSTGVSSQSVMGRAVFWARLRAKARGGLGAGGPRYRPC